MRLVLGLLLAINIAYAADGAPDAVAPDGARYYGALRNGRFEGRLEVRGLGVGFYPSGGSITLACASGWCA